MPSTYSPDLRIELIANGDQSGTWGTTTNSNLGTIIEDAISGLASVSITSSSQALTALNGVADQSRCAAVALTTTTTADFAVYVPPVTKLYVVKNNSAYTATVYCSTVLGNTTAAGTGVAIPTGKSVLLRSDGTNIVEQLNHIAGNLSVAGTTTTTTPSPGDNTTKAATTAFVNTAIASALEVLHPIGSIYTSTVSTNPATLFGFGTWVAFGAGRVMIGNGGGFTAGATGGSADAVVVSHTHTATSVVTDPGHFHSINGIGGWYTGTEPGSYVGGGATRVNNTNSKTTGVTVATTNSTTGVSGTNANLQPYIVVYMWNRTA